MPTLAIRMFSINLLCMEACTLIFSKRILPFAAVASLLVHSAVCAQPGPIGLDPPVASETEEAKDKPAAEAPVDPWTKLPVPRVMPRPGNFNILPKGEGYYSLMDVVHGNWREGPPKSAYPAYALMPPPLFEADFRYIDDPKYNPDFLERLHRIHLGDNWLFGTGGQAWWRHMHEFSARFTGKTNDYDLWRIRAFGDLHYRDVFRIYAEFITANTLSHDLDPLSIDENRADMQNLFFELKLGQLGCQPVYVRAGRQELLFGSQRLISPPDWANTRRTFQGVRLYRASEKFDVDVFWAQPVIPDAKQFDSVDHHQNFYGAWFTYRPKKGTFADFYYLFLDNANKVKLLGLERAPTSVHTLGSRFTGDENGFLWDFEGMLQMGDRGGQPIRAGAATAGLGYNASDLPMNPTVWAYYDWASGDGSPNAGNYNTFNQLFPFGHYYFGWLDLVGRQNIRDWNMHLYLYPAKWITFNLQYHFFALDKSRDALYGVAGLPSRVSLNGSAGGVVGQELDLIFNFHITKRTDFMVGYSKLNAGEFISNTGNGRSPELWYMMYNVRW